MWSIATIVCITGLNSMISQWIISFIFGGFSPEEYYKETGVNPHVGRIESGDVQTTSKYQEMETKDQYGSCTI